MKLYLHIGIPRTANFLQTKIFSRLSHLHFIGPPSKITRFLIMEAFVKHLWVRFHLRSYCLKIAISQNLRLLQRRALNESDSKLPNARKSFKKFFQEIKVILFFDTLQIGFYLFMVWQLVRTFASFGTLSDSMASHFVISPIPPTTRAGFICKTSAFLNS